MSKPDNEHPWRFGRFWRKEQARKAGVSAAQAEYQRQYHANRRQARREQGLCVECGGPRHGCTTVACDSCLSKRRVVK